jgi:3-methyl-2-oxobutanoate hydroxymethyltransferase
MKIARGESLTKLPANEGEIADRPSVRFESCREQTMTGTRNRGTTTRRRASLARASVQPRRHAATLRSCRMSQRPDGPVTLRTLRKMCREGVPFACLTAYDATSARWLERAGVHVLLVGDTAAEMVLGYSRTIDMPLDVAVILTAAVKRGAPDTVVMADMPFMSYQAGEDEAVHNAARFLTQGMADIVKVEADASFESVVAKMARAGIPICGHVGSRPQRAAMTVSYGAAGRTAEEADAVVRDAVAMERAGCVMLLVEAVPPEVTDRIMKATSLPLIGIGAGTACHGQVLVLHDLVGLTDAPPRFAARSADLGQSLKAAGADWVQRVRERRVGGETYTMKTPTKG